MNICFLLPRFVRSQSGGYKIVYEYANRLSEKGHNVSLLYLNENALKRYHLPECIRKIVINWMTDHGPKWFELDCSIQKISTCKPLFMEMVGNIETVVFTAIETIEYEKLFPKTKKLYLIQDYENWRFNDEYVKQSYARGYKNIVVAQWLKNVVDEYSNTPSIVIKNPIDIEIYKPIIPIEKRKPYAVSVNYRSEEYKGFKYTYNAIKILKKKYPELRVYAFGTDKRPAWMPNYFSYTRFASLDQTVEIYNRTSIFICGSVEEGYGLTGLEAMACGTALISTGYRGVYEYAEDEINSLISQVKDSNSLAKNAIKLIDSQDLRIKIAKAGVSSVREGFDWKVAVERFEKEL